MLGLCVMLLFKGPFLVCAAGTWPCTFSSRRRAGITQLKSSLVQGVTLQFNNKGKQLD